MKSRSRFHLALATLVLTAGGSSAGAADWTPLLDPNLSQWEIWMGAPHSSVTGLPEGTPKFDDVTKGTPLGLGQNPKEVFTVIEEDGQLVLRITGEIYAGLTSLAEYGDFQFTAQVRWGSAKWAPRETAKRDSGLLYHCTGPHGAFWNVWKRCVEFQIQEGDFGDLYLLAGTGADLRFAPTEDPNGPRVWDPAHPLQPTGRGRRSADHESVPGEWTTIEIHALGREAIHLVNGHLVLALENIRLRDGTPLSRGQLQIQSEGAEVHFRDIRIRPITTIPAELRAAAGFAP